MKQAQIILEYVAIKIPKIKITAVVIAIPRIRVFLAIVGSDSLRIAHAVTPPMTPNNIGKKYQFDEVGIFCSGY